MSEPEISPNLHSAAVVESIIGQIPDEVKASVTIDYEQIPESYFKKIKLELGIRSVDPKQAADLEQKLLEGLNQEGAFTNNMIHIIQTQS